MSVISESRGKSAWKGIRFIRRDAGEKHSTVRSCNKRGRSGKNPCALGFGIIGGDLA